MAEKTPHELLRESLERNAAEVAKWPDWLRSAISTRGVFSVAPVEKSSDRSEHDEAAPLQGLGFTSR